jgi:hypothetical protein
MLLRKEAIPMRLRRNIIALLLAGLMIMPQTAEVLAVQSAANTTTDEANATDDDKEGSDAAGTEADDEDVNESGREIFNIDSIDDFTKLEELCRKGRGTSELDVQLNADLSLSEYEDFDGIQSFSGHFHGNGYKIEGLRIDSGDGAVGLFAYIEKSALVENLVLDIILNSDDSSNYIGGIAGVNAGTIDGCTVMGLISGTGVTGGVAGLNGGEGTITGCVSEAFISSSRSVGGIAGENRGLITKCKNSGEVNADSTWIDSDDEAVLSLTPEGILSYLTSIYETGKDIGGIAGWSIGRITYSQNVGVVGYQHAGRNVGGIAGRFCGTIYRCTNKGKVYGKQDVGGIAGQFEPTIIQQEGESISSAVNKLNDLQNQLVSDVNTAKDSIQSELNNVTDTMQTEVDRYQDDDTEDNSSGASVKALSISRSNSAESSGDNPSTDTTGNSKDISKDTVKDTADTAKDKTDTAKDTAKDTADTAKDTAKDTAETAKDNASNASDTLSDAASVSDISDKITSASDDLPDYDELQDSLASVSDALTKAQNTINAQSDELVSDINAINDKVTDINNLAQDRKDNLERIKDGGDLIEDYSSIDPDNLLASRISGCVNKGYVNGDRNVGGIAGAMAIEGSDSDDSDDEDSSEIHMTLAVLSDCKNSGIIIIKKENGGGIAGYGDMGYISNSTDTGRLEGEEANYLGGIAGNYKGTIDGCSSVSVISGNKYIGGIAGQARRVRNCYSMATIAESSGWQGAILGNVSSDSSEDDESVIHSNLMNSIYKNYYVNDTLYGINGSSYQGVAEGISYNKLLAIAGVSEEFSNLRITFLDEDYNVLGRTAIEYGASLENIVYPTVEIEPGEYLNWSGHNGRTATGNVFLQVEVADESATLKSEMTRNGKPVGYVLGAFTELSEFVMDDVTDEYFPNNRSERVYSISLYNAANDSLSETKLRILKETDDGNVTVCLRGGDGWKEVDVSDAGSYVEVSFEGSEAIVRLTTEEKKNYTIVIAAAVAAVAVLAAALLIGRKRRTKKLQEKQP